MAKTTQMSTTESTWTKTRTATAVSTAQSTQSPMPKISASVTPVSPLQSLRLKLVARYSYFPIIALFPIEFWIHWNLRNLQAGKDAHGMRGEYCMDEQYRTDSNGRGPFNPRDQCEKSFHNHDKDQCCGIYPNRYPYDSNFRECCQTGKISHN